MILVTDSHENRTKNNPRIASKNDDKFDAVDENRTKTIPKSTKFIKMATGVPDAQHHAHQRGPWSPPPPTFS